MRVELGERESQFDQLREDDAFVELIESVAQRAFMLRLLIELIRQFKTDTQFRGGVGGRRPEDFANAYTRGRQRSRSERMAVSRLVRNLGSLYRAHAGRENLLRGFIVEMIVKQALRSRYAASGADILEDNVMFMIDNGSRYESAPRTIDVIGFEFARRLGEVHDCKLHAIQWKNPKALAWARELETHVASRGLRVGLVTTTARDQARPILESLGLGGSSQLVPLEAIWQLTPLQR